MFVDIVDWSVLNCFYLVFPGTPPPPTHRILSKNRKQANKYLQIL